MVEKLFFPNSDMPCLSCLIVPTKLSMYQTLHPKLNEAIFHRPINYVIKLFGERPIFSHGPSDVNMINNVFRANVKLYSSSSLVTIPYKMPQNTSFLSRTCT